jgi:hypothetical protein
MRLPPGPLQWWWSFGFLAKQQIIPLITTAEWKAAMDKAKGTNTDYTPPTQAR